jgi:hypothetical protein
MAMTCPKYVTGNGLRGSNQIPLAANPLRQQYEAQAETADASIQHAVRHIGRWRIVYCLLLATLF